jgi:uroporphyrinogen decarboxylase
LVEGRPSRTYEHTKALMYTEPDLWFALLDRLADLAIASLHSQVANGASAVQLFDSWAGALSPSDYVRYVQPASAKVLESIGTTGVPRIHFGVNTGELLGHMRDAGADVMGVDWRVDLDAARTRLGDQTAIQGNLDPVAVLAGVDVALERTRDVLARADGFRGHIFNLGHGVLPATDPEVLEAVVELVHAEGTVR